MARVVVLAITSAAMLLGSVFKSPTEQCRPDFGVDVDRMVFDRRVAALRMARCNADVHEKERVLAHVLIACEEA